MRKRITSFILALLLMFTMTTTAFAVAQPCPPEYKGTQYESAFNEGGYAGVAIAAASNEDTATVDAAMSSRAEKTAAQGHDPGMAGSGGSVSVADTVNAVSASRGNSTNYRDSNSGNSTTDQTRAVATVAAAFFGGSGDISQSELRTLTETIAAVNKGTADKAQIEAAAMILCVAQGNEYEGHNITVAEATITAGTYVTYAEYSDRLGYWEGGTAYVKDAASGNWVPAEG